MYFGRDKSLRYKRKVLGLFESGKVRDAVTQLVEPAARPDIDRITIKNACDDPIQSIDKRNLHLYQVPGPKHTPLTDETQRIAYTLRSIWFEPEEPWRLNTSNSVVQALIEDQSLFERPQEWGHHP